MKKIIFLLIITLTACQNNTLNNLELKSTKIKIEYNNLLYSRIINPLDSNDVTKGFSASEYIVIAGDTIKDFKFEKSKSIETDTSKILRISGIFKSEKYKIKKIVNSEIITKFPSFIITRVQYTNLNKNAINISAWVNNHYNIPVNDTNEVVWSYQSGSYEERPDWVLKVPNGFYQKNYMGMNATDYGGGTPVADVWKKNIGLAVGHLEKVPKLVSLPVKRKNKFVSIEINQEKEIKLKKNESFKTYKTFVTIHNGDYFTTLSNYSSLMHNNGLNFKKISDAAYEPIWCAWGYERNFKVKDILRTLPKVKELGFKWVVLDDGWQTSEGDWYLNRKKFPNGDTDMKEFVDKIHSYGLKAKLWWAPLAADPGTDLVKQHSDMLLINKDGKYQDISWWDSYYLCPAYKPTLEYTKNLVEKFIDEWGYDGLKIDGQHMNAAPPCYNPKHHHKYPEESFEAMPKFYDSIFETVMKYKKDAVVEICPCGDAYSFFMLPYINQPVSSDPTSSWQIRTKGKTMKALMGPSAPYYGDHVELSSGGEDFASTVGVGGVVGSKFVWPVGVYFNKETGDISLTPQREKKWKKWINIYNDHVLPKGEYLGNLYDIGFDRPETHVIRKADSLFYAFYADEYEGDIEFRGLDKNAKYRISDYVNNIDYGIIQSKNPNLKIKFKNYLLLKLIKL